MRPELRIADNFSFPIELVTSTQAILARKRSGKSYTASVEAEEMLENGQQIAVIDPTSAWYGLRSSADGNGPGYPVVVFGGDHADAPLDFRSGKQMARALVDHRFSAIFDVGSWETEEQITFAFAFASELLRINRAAMHLFIDEADTFAPQLLESREQKKCLGAMSRLVKQGGIKGIGVTMITQRSADINKKLLSQIDILTVLRMSAPDDLVPPIKWIAANVDPEYAKEVERALPRLGVGKAYICSNLTGRGEYVEVRQRRTFNSGATPKPGEKRSEPSVLAPIDIQKLGREIAASVEEQKKSDPEELKRRIADLEREVVAAENKGNEGREQMLVQQIQEMETELADARAKLAAYGGAESDIRALHGALAALVGQTERIVALFDGTPIAPEPVRPQRYDLTAHNAPCLPQPPPALAPARIASRGTAMPKACRAILTALAQHGHCSKSRIAAITGYSVGGGGFNNAISECRTKGWISGSDPLAATREGLAALGPVEPLPTGQQLLAMWNGKLGKAEREILNALARSRSGISKHTLAEVTGYAADGGGFNNAISRLRTLELVEGKGELRLTPDFAQAVRA